jgi:hypothetical protein
VSVLLQGDPPPPRVNQDPKLDWGELPLLVDDDLDDCRSGQAFPDQLKSQSRFLLMMEILRGMQ